MGSILDQRPPTEEGREPILRSPPIVTAFILAFIVVHVGMLFFDEATFYAVFDILALTPEPFAYFGWNAMEGLASALVSYMSLVTYAFLHGDFVHLIFNSLWFLIFATAVARRVGTGRFLALSLAATLGAAMLVHPPGRRFYVDWSATARSDPHLVFNLHVVLALQIATELAKQFEPKMETFWQTAAGRLQQRCRDGFVRNGRFYDDLAHTTYSQLGAAMALLTNSATPDEADALLDEMIARSLNERDEHEAGEMVLASPFMHHYIFEGLGRYGRTPASLDIIKLRWGRWVNQGYPTTWENWNVDFPDGSQCHAFSAHPRYHLAKIFSQ